MAKKGLGLPGDSAEEPVYTEDFSDVESKFPTVSEGRHYAQVIEFFQDESQSGNDMFVWQLVVIGKDDEDAGIEIRTWTSLVPQARWRLAKVLDDIGIEATGKSVSFKASEIVGRMCIIDVTHNSDGKHQVDETYPVEPEKLAELKKELKEGDGPDIPF
jgi:hypothetical protein